MTSSFRPENQRIMVSLAPLAWTPLGVSLGATAQQVGVAFDGLASWMDQTFAPDDDRAFLGSMRDIELLRRLEWQATPPAVLSAAAILNADDLSDDLLHALGEPPSEVVPCGICRRLSVRDDFIWNDRQLCAWDFHTTVFGRRGPWHNEAYAERHFATIPHPRYLVPNLLEELNVEIIVSIGGIPTTLQQEMLNTLITRLPGPAYLLARTGDGLALLRERISPD